MNEHDKNIFLAASGIRKKFRISRTELEVLKGVSFRIERGQWTALLGASGSGKTTLLDILGTISVPDSGTLEIDGINPAALSGRELVKFRQKRIGFVFQAYHIMPELNILENVMLPMMFAGGKKSDCRAKAEELLYLTGLKDRLLHRPNELSGGEQQRAAIARALINSPDLLLADEPTGNLDSVTGGGILEIFENIRAKRETTIVMVTHDRTVANLADRTITLKDGVIAE